MTRVLWGARRACVWALMLVVTAVSSPALAGGVEYNDNDAKILGRGGAWVAKADGPMAINYNPAGLVLMKGHKLMLSANLNFMSWKFTRSGTTWYDADPNPFVSEARQATIEELVAAGIYESATVENENTLFPAPSLAYAYGHPSGKWGLGFGLYGPGAHGSRKFPEDAPSRFMLTKAEILLAYLTGSFAYNISKKLSVGVSLQYVTMPTNQIGLIVDGDTGLNEQLENSVAMTKVEMDVPDWTGFAAILGVHFRPTDFLEMGLSSRVTPVSITGRGTQTLSSTTGQGLIAGALENGTLGFVSNPIGSKCGGDDEPACNVDNGVSFSLTLPPWIRGGLRYVLRDDVHPEREIFDIEIDFVYEFWSVYEDYLIEFDGNLNLFGNVLEMDPIRLPKKFDDTWALRIGGDWNAVDEFLTLRAGVHYESAAQPVEYTNLDFTGFERVGVALGATFSFGPVDLSAGYQLLWQPTRKVLPEEAELRIQRPLSDPIAPSGWDEDTQGEFQGLVVNAGTYESMYHTIGLSLQLNLGEEPDDTPPPPPPVDPDDREKLEEAEEEAEDARYVPETPTPSSSVVPVYGG